MKKIVLILFLISGFLYSNAQFGNKQFLGAPNTMVESRGGVKADTASVIPTYEDTAAASRGNRANQYRHSLIGVKNDLWMRDAEGGNGDWLRVGSGASLCQGITYGGVVTWDSLLIFDINAAAYCIVGNSYFSNDTTITLAAADPSLPRIDVFVLNTSGQVAVLQGTPDANPTIPQINPNTQLYLTAVLINAGETTPANISKDIVYNENLGNPTEWATGSTMASGTVNYDNTNFPYIGSKAALVSSQADGTLSFTAPDTIQFSSYNVLQFFLRRGGISDPGTSVIQVGFTFEGVPVSSLVPVNFTYGYDVALIGSYQNISIPIPAFTLTSSIADGLIIKVVGNDQLYLDYVQLQSGIIPPSTNLDGRYLKLFVADTTYAVKTIKDSVRLLSTVPASLVAGTGPPSPPLSFITNARDTIGSANIVTQFDIYSQAKRGALTPNFDLYFKSKNTGITPLTLNTGGDVILYNGLRFQLDGSRSRIFSNNTILYRSQSTTEQNLFLNGATTSLTGNVVNIQSGIAPVTSSSARILNITGDYDQSIFTSKPDGSLAIGTSTPNRYASLYVASLGRGVVFDTMNTAKRNAMVQNVATVTLTNGGSGYNSAPGVSAGSSAVGGLDAKILATVSGGAVTALTITFSGSGYPSGGSLTFNNAGTGGTGAAGTFTVSTGTLPVGLMIFNTDSTCYQSWNGSSWDNMREGSGGGGGGSQNLQQTLDNGTTLTTNNTVNAANTRFTIDSLNEFNTYSYVGSTRQSNIKQGPNSINLSVQNATTGFNHELSVRSNQISVNSGDTTLFTIGNPPIAALDPDKVYFEGSDGNITKGSITPEINRFFDDSSTVVIADSPIVVTLTETPGARDTVRVSYSAPYKVYTALLSQEGTDPPVATVLENTLSGTVTWSYSAANTYDATLTGAFTANKTWCIITLPTDDYSVAPRATRINDDSCRVMYDEGIGAGIQVQVEIRVYN